MTIINNGHQKNKSIEMLTPSQCSKNKHIEEMTWQQWKIGRDDTHTLAEEERTPTKYNTQNNWTNEAIPMQQFAKPKVDKR